MANTKIARARAQVSGLSKRLSDAQGTSYTGAAMNIAAVQLGAFGAGVLDVKVGEVAGQRPSVAAGVGLAVVGVMMKSPLAVKAASGMLAPLSYEAGKTAFDAE